MQISTATLPTSALLNRYAEKPGHYADCYITEVAGEVSIADFVEAFFNSPILRLERQLLRFIAPASSKDQVVALANGTGETLSGWQLEERADDQILLIVMGGGIRTWLMVENLKGKTRLLFGSAVIPRNPDSENPELSWVIRATTGFHKLYSRIVLAAAKWQLNRMAR